MVTHRLNVVVLGNSTFYEFVVVLQNSKKKISGSLTRVDRLAGFSIKFYSSKHKGCVVSKFATYNKVFSPF